MQKGSLLEEVFRRRSIWRLGLMQARRGAKRHLTYTINNHTVCGVSSYAMQMVQRGQLWMSYPPGPAGQPGRDLVEKLEREVGLAGLVLHFTTCKDCLAKMAALALLVEDDQVGT